MLAYGLLAVQSVQTMGDDAFQIYRAAVVACGVLLVALGWWGMGAGVAARVTSVAIGVALLGYGGYLWFFLPAGLVEVYPFLFILPFLVVGYLLYSRVERKEIDAAVRAQLAAERAQRRATRAAEGEIRAARGEIRAARGEIRAARGETQAAQGEIRAAEGETRAAQGEAPDEVAT